VPYRWLAVEERAFPAARCAGGSPLIGAMWKREVHMMTIESTHTVDGKYIASTLGSAKSQRRIAKMLKKTFTKLLKYNN
jgi:hypothetical protein